MLSVMTDVNIGTSSLQSHGRMWILVTRSQSGYLNPVTIYLFLPSFTAC